MYLMKTYYTEETFTAAQNSVIDTLNISEFIQSAENTAKNAWINIGGW